MRLVLVAAGGLAREALEAVRAGAAHEVVGALDDDGSRWGGSVSGVDILGGIDRAPDLIAADADLRLVICAGKGAGRAAIAARLAAAGIGDDRYATVIHPTVHVPASCTIGAGTILLAGVVLTADVRIGRHVVVMPGAVMTHDDVLGDFATLASGVLLGGWVTVGERAYLGMGSGLRERTTVGPDAVVGMGAVVLDDVPAGQTWAGVPARALELSRASA